MNLIKQLDLLTEDQTPDYSDLVSKLVQQNKAPDAIQLAVRQAARAVQSSFTSSDNDGMFTMTVLDKAGTKTVITFKAENNQIDRESVKVTEVDRENNSVSESIPSTPAGYTSLKVLLPVFAASIDAEDVATRIDAKLTGMVDAGGCIEMSFSFLATLPKSETVNVEKVICSAVSAVCGQEVACCLQFIFSDSITQ